MELLQRPAFSPMEPMAASCPGWLATHLHQAGGAVPFSRFMDLALNEPEHGYYGSGRARIGAQGDFVTSPALGSDFAALLAPQILAWLTSISRSDPDQRLSIVKSALAKAIWPGISLLRCVVLIQSCWLGSNWCWWRPIPACVSGSRTC